MIFLSEAVGPGKIIQCSELRFLLSLVGDAGFHPPISKENYNAQMRYHIEKEF